MHGKNYNTGLIIQFLKKIVIFFITLFIFSCVVSCGVFLQADGSSLSNSGKNNDKNNAAVSGEDHSGNTGTDNGAYKVTEIIDGDTIEVNESFFVRFIGINAPEIDRFFYDESREVLKAILDKKTIFMERDISNKDIHGRYLRYIYVDSLFVNLEMIRRGFANVYTVPPDLKYTEQFLNAEREAMENNRGLWQISEYTPDLNIIIKNEKADEAIKENGSSEAGNIEIFLNYDAEGYDDNNLNGEFLKITNMLNIDIDMNKWTVKDSGINIYEFNSFLLQKNQSLLLYTGFGKDDENQFYWNNTKPVWNNDSDTLYLRDHNGFLAGLYAY